jgi:hypothetical protein
MAQILSEADEGLLPYSEDTGLESVTVCATESILAGR